MIKTLLKRLEKLESTRGNTITPETRAAVQNLIEAILKAEQEQTPEERAAEEKRIEAVMQRVKLLAYPTTAVNRVLSYTAARDWSDYE